MKNTFFNILAFFIVIVSFAQQEYHVFPKNDKTNPGTASGDGSLQSPWDLQTALNQSNTIVKGGDTIWLHQGIYTGRYSSSLDCKTPNKYITVSAYKKDRVILNGNVTSSERQTLKVTGGQVIFKNFEITWLGDFTRDRKDKNFVYTVAGIYHLTGKNCKFINLKIYNNPGVGMGSWKSTGGTLIAECFVFNNGVINLREKGSGEGFYVQNKSEEERILKNNVIFGNYYKGIEVWSAGKKKDFEFVKNITLDNNVIFNSGLPSNITVDNIIVATDDRNGINIAKNIKVINNILYHNTNYKKNQVNGNAPSLTLGFHVNAPIEDVTVDNNIILGRNNALRILYAKSLSFTNNLVYSGYVHFYKSANDYANPKNWKFRNNTYYTKKSGAFRIEGDRNYPLVDWQTKFNIEKNSTKKHIKNFDLDNVLDITRSEYDSNRYRVVLFDKNEQDITVDFSKYGIKSGTGYTVTDVENMQEVLKSGTLNTDAKIVVPMQAVNPSSIKTLNNFGVFIIQFDTKEKAEGKSLDNKIEEKKKDNAFKRFFKWLF